MLGCLVAVQVRHMSALNDESTREPDYDHLSRSQEQRFPRVWRWGLCATPTSIELISRPRAEERLTDVLTGGRELLISCPCSNRRGVDWVTLALLPDIPRCITVGELARRLRCDTCQSSSGRPELTVVARPDTRDPCMNSS